MKNKRLYSILLTVLLVLLALHFFGRGAEPAGAPSAAPAETLSLLPAGETPPAPEETEPAAPEESAAPIDEDGSYTGAEDVALYVHTYGHLPANFITKKEAQALGWEGGKLEPYAPGKSIGGDRFGNYEGKLPKAKGRTWTECDIDSQGRSRGAKRLIFSNDGLIYYSPDHYESFRLLYGEP